MTTLFWLLEYGKVLFAYGFIMFIWPSVIFRKYLRGKGMAFRVAFCATTQIVLINSVVLILGLFHILNPWVVRILFYGSFLYTILKEKPIGQQHLQRARSLMTGTYGVKSLFLDTGIAIKNLYKWCWKRFAAAMQGNWMEYGLLFIVIVYGMVYFSYGAFQDYSYGASDMYPHHAWTYGLVNGQIFAAGVYPEGMHCFIYAQHILFGISIYSCFLFTAGMHVVVFLLSVYILLREVFKYRYSPIFALVLFLTVDALSEDGVYNMSRLQWTIPQEFGLFTQFLCAAFLVKYLRSTKRVPRPQIKAKLTAFKERMVTFKLKKRASKTGIVKIPAEQRVQMPELHEEAVELELTKGYWDENLLVFMLSLAASLAIHFYPVIMAFFVCVSFIILALGKVFSRKRFIPLVTSVFLGFMIAVIPMAGALASGIGFQGSIGWALEIMGIEADKETVDEELELQDEIGVPKESQEVSEQVRTGIWDVIFSPEVVKASDVDATGNDEYILLTLTVKKEQAALEKVKEVWKGLTSGILRKLMVVYNASFVVLYNTARAEFFVGGMLLALSIWLLYRIGATIYKKVTGKEQVDIRYFDGYFALIVSCVLFHFLMGGTKIGLPALIDPSRLCALCQLFAMSVVLIPIDMIFRVIMYVADEEMLSAMGILGAVGIYFGVMVTGNFHGYLYYGFTRFNGAVMTTHMITQSLPKESYTIVSPVDELYQVIDSGYHEELVTFINKTTTDDYTLPTEYVFLFLEKKPLEYAHSHFFSGPGWLAEEKYVDYFITYVSQCPKVSTSIISAEVAAMQRNGFEESSRIYSNLMTRTILESNLYEWCQEFEKLYPGELHTYYEDEFVACYYFKQNKYSLYQLGIR